MLNKPPAPSQADDEAFRQFFETTLRPAIVPLQQQRSRYRLAVILVTLATFALALTVFYHVPNLFATPQTPVHGRNWFSMILFAIVAALTVRYILRRVLRKSYLHAFRQTVLSPIRAFAASDLGYDGGRRLDESLYKKSLLFAFGPDSKTRYEEAGLFSGTCAGRTFSFSNILGERTYRHGCRLKKSTAFGGLFLSVEQCPRFDGFVLAAPKASGMNEDVMAARTKGMKDTRWEEVKAAGNPEFNLWFIAFASDRAQSEIILGHDTTETLVKLRTGRGVDSFFSRLDDRLHLALATGRTHFQPPFPGEALDYAKCLEYRDDVAWCMELIRKMCSWP